MTNLYYDIFETATHVEYHSSSNREEVVNRKSMNRRITSDNPEKEQYKIMWQMDADFYGAVKVESK